MARQNLLQWNCRSLISKKSDFIYLLNRFEPFVFALAETWLKPTNTFKVSGYHSVRDDRPDGYGGVAIFIKNTISFTSVSLPVHSDELSIVAVSVNNMCIVSLYIPRPSVTIFNEVNQILTCLPKPCLILGDFNSHHQAWGSSSSNYFGEKLMDILDSHNLCTLNTGCPTRLTGPDQSVSAVDLSICSPNFVNSLTWQTLPSSYGSDHFPILISFPTNNNLPTVTSNKIKYILPESDSDSWDRYKNLVEEKARDLPTINSDNVTHCAESFAKMLTEVATELYPVKNNRPSKIPSPPWWDPECTQAIKKRKEAERNYRRNMTTENFDILSNIMNETRKLFKNKKFESWRQFCLSISQNTPPSLVWRNLRRFKSAMMSDSSSPVISTALANNFVDKLAPSWVPRNLNDPCLFISSAATPSDLDHPFSLLELKGIINNRKDSAPGADGIQYSCLSHLSDNSLSYYLNIINHIMQLESNNIPLSWKSQIILPFLKPNKSPSDPSAYRPIALSTVLMKLAEHLVKNRLEWHLESKGLLSESQYGFRKGKGTLDNISILTSDIRIAFSNNKFVSAVFLDISAAYDNVLIPILLKKLQDLSVPLKFVRFIFNILSERFINLTSTDSNFSRTIYKGLPQGSVLSPILYNVYTVDLESVITDPTVNILQYADDLLIYNINQSYNDSCSVLTSTLHNIKTWMDANGLELSASKSSVVLFTRTRNPQPIQILYDGVPIPVKQHTKFLGLILDSKLTGTPHCDYVVGKCERLINMLRCLSGVWWGAHPFSMKLIYNALIRSVLDYGTFLLEPGNVSAFKKLDLIQSKALRIITGAMKTSPINALQVECCEPPLKLRRQYLCDRFIFRALQIRNHPLYFKLEQLSSLVNSSPYWSHKAPPCPVVSFRKFTSFEAPTHRCSYLPIFSVNFEALILPPLVNLELNIPKNPKHSNNKFNEIVVQNWQGWHYIFCDASKHSPDSNVGVGVYHQQYNIIQKIKLPPESTVFTGECFGLYKSIEYVLIFKLKQTVVFSDSKSALEALCKFSFHKSNHNFPLIFECKKMLHECFLKGLQITFVWVPSHCGILGNEKSDILANDAVSSGDMFPYKNFCHDLVSLTKSFLWKAWQEHWDNSGQVKGRNYYKIQPIIPAKPWFYKCTLDKRSSSIITRMRLGHVCTPEHLAKLKIVPTNMCECGTDIGSLDHLFFACPFHDHTPFIEDLVSLRIPLPSSVHLLLSLNNIDVYYILSKYIKNNDIKI